MGMLAQYMAVDNKILNKMLEMDNEKIIDEIEELSEDEKCDICDIDKMWDGLHFLLTGKSAARVIKDSKLSEAVVGTAVFDTEDENEVFLAYIKADELPAIVNALENIEIKDMIKKYSMDDFKQSQIYPNIWKKEDEADIYDELAFCFKGMLDFYKKCCKKNMNIVISIY